MTLIPLGSDTECPPDPGVVVTGLGVVIPGGVGLAAFLEFLKGGDRAIHALPPSRAAGLPPGFGGVVPRESLRGRFDGKLLRTSTMADATLLGVCAAHEALADAGLRYEDGPFPEAGVYIGSSICPPSFDKQARTALGLGERGEAPGSWWMDDGRLGQALKSQSAFDFLKALPNMVASHLSIQGNLQGPVGTFLGSDASGLQAVGEAWHAIRNGDAEVMLCGAAFSPFQEIHLAWLKHRGLLSSWEGPPEESPLPYGHRGRGMVPAEGAVVLVLEKESRACRRGARSYGRLTGYATRFALPGEARAAVAAREDVLRAAMGKSTVLDAVSLDGPGIPWVEDADEEALLSWGNLPRFLPSATSGFLGPVTGPLGLTGLLLALDTPSLLGPSIRRGMAASFSVDGPLASVMVEAIPSA